MRHARAEALDRLEPLLARLREVSELRERSRGVFYRGSKAFLHFHEDGGQLFADVRLGIDFERLDVTTDAAQLDLVEHVRDAIDPRSMGERN